jgi:hypothetical protein
MKKTQFLPLFILAFNCGMSERDSPALTQPDFYYKTIADIKVPEDSKRMAAATGSFAEWLGKIRLKKDKHVYLFNGSLKQNQQAQFAVLDIPVGKKDLQQCADAVMRLRAEFLFSEKRFDEIRFWDNAGKLYEWMGNNNKQNFENYLEKVFGFCGTASLEKQLKPVAGLYEIKAGDVFIKGGFPGHAMLVVDIAIAANGTKYFMLAQSYMPAQDIHIVKNPNDEALSPWYEVSDADIIMTPEWKFYKNHLRQW